jgi:hypothetical protein
MTQESAMQWVPWLVVELLVSLLQPESNVYNVCNCRAMIFSCNQRAMWAMCAKGTQYCDQEAGMINAPNAFSMSITGPNQIVLKIPNSPDCSTLVQDLYKLICK